MTSRLHNVIRPTFGARREVAAQEPAASEQPEAEYQPLWIFGTAAGHLVALLQDDAAPEGPLVRVVVDPETGSTV